MPTVDLISPGGAFTPAAKGDTQDITQTFTIGSGSTALTCNSASPFVSGDTGKSFNLVGAGPSGGVLSGTLTFVSSSLLTLSVAASTALVAQSTRFVWGTDDSGAIQAMNDWAQIQTSAITVTLGSGSRQFFINSADPTFIRGNSPTYNVKKPITVLGNGRSASILKAGVAGGFFLGAQNTFKSGDGNFGGANIWTARLFTAYAGQNFLVCKTPSDANQFFPNTWAMVGSLDMQGGGSPQNPFFFQYVFILTVDNVTGIITLAQSLRETHLDHYPVINAGVPGSHPDCGGPATLWAMDPAWDIDATFQSMGTDQSLPGSQTYAVARNVAFVDYQCFDGDGLTPSTNLTMSFTNCDLTAYLMEVDKDIDTLIFDSSTTGQLKFQSSINKLWVRNGSNISALNGTPRFTEVHASLVGGLFLGPNAFGRTDSFVTSGSTFTGFFQYSGPVDSGDTAGATSLQSDYSMVNNVIRIPKPGLTYGLRWAIPGTQCFFGGDVGPPSFSAIGWGYMFTVLDVFDDPSDPSYMLVITDWPYSGFPFWADKIEVLASATVNFAADTVSSIPEITNFVNSTAAGYSIPATYSSAQCNGSSLGVDATGLTIGFPFVCGRLLSLIVEVVTPYTGVHNPLIWRFSEFNNSIIVKEDMSLMTYAPSIDLRTPGKRVITPEASTIFGADSGLDPFSARNWFTEFLYGSQSSSSGCFCASSDIRAEYAANPAVGPVVNVTAITSLAPLPIQPAQLPRPQAFM